ncbi:MAG: four helix bundle protein [Cyclobacteriaceae bacterium]
MHRYKELLVWQKAMDLSQQIYEQTANFPSEEKFGLVSQMRRCSVSIASNIAEGAGRNSNGEFNQFLGIAQGSAFELETQVLLATRMRFISNDDEILLSKQLSSITNMIFKLKETLKS